MVIWAAAGGTVLIGGLGGKLCLQLGFPAFELASVPVNEYTRTVPFSVISFSFPLMSSKSYLLGLDKSNIMYINLC